MCGYVQAVAKKRSTTDEILQEISLALFRQLPEHDKDRPLLAWAIQIAKLQVLGLRRDAIRSRIAFDTDLLARFTETWVELAPSESDQTDFLKDCLDRLAGKARQIVHLRYYERAPA